MSTTRDDAERQVAPVRLATIRLASDSQNEPLFAASLEQPLRRSLVPGTDVERRTKTWRLSPLTDSTRKGVVLGRVGFDEARETTAWDDKVQDFVESAVREGNVFPFALNLIDGRLAYQADREHSTSVLAAFQALLNKPQVARWRVERVMQTRTWEQWRATTDRVTSIYMTWRRPNPSYTGRERVGEAVQGTRAGVVQFAATADPNDLEGLDMESVFIAQGVEHARLGYGKVTARGEREVDGQTVVQSYSSATETTEHVVEVEARDGIVSNVALAETAATVEVDVPDEATSDESGE